MLYKSPKWDTKTMFLRMVTKMRDSIGKYFAKVEIKYERNKKSYKEHSHWYLKYCSRKVHCTKLEVKI